MVLLNLWTIELCDWELVSSVFFGLDKSRIVIDCVIVLFGIFFNYLEWL